MECQNKSLLIVPVTCPLCGEKHIPFYSLQRRTMVSQSNIFGIQQYKEALKGKEFCDYNLIRVTICPVCFYASGNTQDFISESSLKRANPEPFDKEPIVDKWLASTHKRAKLAEPYLDGLFGEHRTFKQAMLSYNLALISANAVLKTEEIKKERARDYSIAFKSATYMLIKAEMLMSNNKAGEAEKLARAALDKLEEIFPFLTRESSVRAGYLMGMLGLYFDIPKTVSQSFSFLQQYGNANKVRYGTDEHKALVTSLKKFSEVYQSRSEFNRTNLSGFDKPFEF